MTSSGLTVVVCTFNRSGMLRDTLSSFDRAVREVPPDLPCEVVVVDNGSTDNTATVTTEAARASAVPLRYVREPERGLSNARNTGVREARYDIVGFVDDDVYVRPGWAHAIVRTFVELPEAGCVGGQTIPLFEGGRPDWIGPELMPFYGSTGSGAVRRQMNHPEHPFGVNMAIRKTVFDAIGGFDPALGRVRGNLRSNEESDFFRRAGMAGFQIVYEPTAILDHRIPAERARAGWVLSRAYWQGISDVVMEHLGGSVAARRDLARLGIAELKTLVRGVRGGRVSPRRIYWHLHGLPFAAKVHYAYKLGRGRQLLLSAFTGRHRPAHTRPARTSVVSEDHAS